MDAYLDGHESVALHFMEPFYDSEIDLLAYFLRRCEALTELHFDVLSDPSEETIVGLFDAIADGKTVESLELMNLGTCSPATISALTRILRNCPISQFSLDLGLLGDKGLAMIRDGLEDKSVTILKLFGDEVLTPEGTEILKRFVERHPTLVTVQMWNLLDDAGLSAFASGLDSSSIERLLFGSSSIGNQGLFALAEFVRLSTKLKYLHLMAHNQVAKEGTIAIAEGLKENVLLETMILEFASEQGVEAAFIDALEHNVTLTQLTLRRCSDATIGNLLLRNKNLIPAAVRRAALMLIGICGSNNYEGMGKFATFPKDVLRLLAQAVWATRRDPVWIQALK